MVEQHFPTLIELLCHRAQQKPNQIVHTFLHEGEIEAGHLTYQDLDRQARAIAAQLQSLKATGERALLLYPQGLEVVAAFYGCLYAGVVAVPAPPPTPARLKQTLPRLQAIIQDTQASLVLTTTEIKSAIEGIFLELPEFQKLQWLTTETVSLSLAQTWQQPNIDSNTLAYLQYTSGSTSAPKGVMISHGNLLHTCASSSLDAQYTADSSITSWLPYFHDYGLVAGLVQPVYADIPCLLMSPLVFIKRPEKWLEIISRYGSTHSAGANFAYEHCVRRITIEQRSKLELSSWQVATVGAEPIRRETLQRFVDTFSKCGFRWNAFDPGYGLAEATLTVSCCSNIAKAPTFRSFAAASLEKNRVVEVSTKQSTTRIIELAGCGQPASDMKVIIVHPEAMVQISPDEVGEIWVSGPSVALGYWNNPETTQHTFQAYLIDTGEGPFLRTGDLGFFKDGELFIAGRIKDLIIINGANHYPQDIEVTIEKSHLLIQPGCSAAFSINVAEQERLVVVAEVEDNQQPETIISAIRQAISRQHELRVYAVVLLKVGNISKTASGKIQRSDCRRDFIENNLAIVSEWRDSACLAAQKM